MSNKRAVVLSVVLVLVAAVVGVVTPWQLQTGNDEVMEALAKVSTRASVAWTVPKPLFSDMVERSQKGVVHIKCPQWQGSGFVVGPNLIVTARHCVEGVEDFVITTNDGHKLRATRAISDKEHDVAFIRIDDLTCIEGEHKDSLTCKKSEHQVKLHPLPLGSIKDCRLGQNVYVIGSPYGKINFNALSTGVISGVDRDWSPLGDDYGWEVAFTVDSAGHPGNSGCPVFTTDGVVRGILVGGFSPVLISVMPCDLFLADLDSIRLMFTQDRYKREVEWSDYSYGSGIVESRDAGNK
jgi:S1-C subfamily serine protease